MKTLILGAVRSGKSRYAGELARERPCEVTLIATGTALDDEMAARIAAHRRDRPANWRVVEEPIHLAASLRSVSAPAGIVIVDCLTLWITNLLCSKDPEALHRETLDMLETLPALPGDCLLVANEVGLGVMPVNALARRFADEAGLLHQKLAALCDRVVFMVAGLPLSVKGAGAGAA